MLFAQGLEMTVLFRQLRQSGQPVALGHLGERAFECFCQILHLSIPFPRVCPALEEEITDGLGQKWGGYVQF